MKSFNNLFSANLIVAVYISRQSARRGFRLASDWGIQPVNCSCAHVNESLHLASFSDLKQIAGAAHDTSAISQTKMDNNSRITNRLAERLPV